ncbi:MAG: restriction endonuclease subunit S [Treponema sp.]|nr:restriction endonuclease subunit S [Treponema sp.]
MTEEIKTRIEQIQNGKVPDGYKKSLTGKWIIPDSWNVIKLSDVATHKILKNTELKYKETYTNSATQGIIKQTDYFDKNISGYYIVDENDYVYNPRISTSAPCGPINKSHIKKTGIMSPLYTVFSMNKENKQNAFFEEYFRSSFWHRYIKEIEEKQKQKKYLMQKLLSNDGKKFTIGDVVIDKEKWKEESFSNIFNILRNNTFTRADLNFTSGLVKNIHYGDILVKFPSILNIENNIVPFLNNNIQLKENTDYLQNGDIVIADTAEDYTAGKAIEIINIKDKRIVSGLHTIPCRPKTKSFAPKWLGYYINSPTFHNQLIPLITGTKVSAISKYDISKTFIPIPSIPEQKIIAEILSAADKEIELLKNGLEQEKQKKISLTQLLLTGIARVKV